MKQLFNRIFYWREISLLRKLRKYAERWYVQDLYRNNITPCQKGFAYPDSDYLIGNCIIGQGLCNVIQTLQLQSIISMSDETRLSNLIKQYRLKLAIPIEGSTPMYEVFYFKRGELQPRLEYIDAIINHLKHE